MGLTTSPLLSSVPKLRHGFTNRALSTAELAKIELRTFLPRQIHGDQLLWAEPPFPEKRPEADAIATFAYSFPIGVQTADCVPLLFVALDGKSRPFSLLAVHAGWRGSALGITGKALSSWVPECQKMRPLRAIYGAIGPAIGGKVYEVGADVAANFSAEFSRPAAREGKFFLDLAAANVMETKSFADKLNVRVELDQLDACTFSTPNLYPSFRRDGAARPGGKPDRILAFLELEP